MSGSGPKRKRPRDANQLAKAVVDIATGEIEDREPTPEEQGKDPAAVSLGRRGGLKGGKARAEKMTAKQRSEIAKKAAEARWEQELAYSFTRLAPLFTCSPSWSSALSPSISRSMRTRSLYALISADAFALGIRH